jgi:CheY-like chemotaxis protein
VIDDDPAVCRLIQEYLVSTGYEVATASNGRDGVELARRLRPFAITLDVLMPGFDGWETLRELKADPATKDIHVVVISVSEDRATGMALGAAAYLVKPVDRSLLLAELRRLTAMQPIRRILAVDDDPSVLRQLEAMLREEGYHVLTADGGEDAVRLATGELPDAVILDLIMPDVDGFAVLHRLREEWSTRDIPVIVLTAKDLTAQEKEELTSAARRIITKGAMDRDRLLWELRQSIEGLQRSQPDPLHGRRPTVLVVEDNEVAATQIQSALEECGHTVAIASSGEEAVRRVQEAVPDAIILDLMMPGMDGFEVLERLRSTPQTARIPVLVLTAKELTEADRVRLTHNNIQQLVQKGSLDRDELVACVDRLIGRPAEPVAPPARPAPVRSGPAGEGVLVVENNPDNLLTITAILDEIGCKYRTARNGREAVELTRELRPRLVLMDIQLPEVSGEDATRAIRSDPSVAGVPIIAITAKAMKGDRERILACGCDDYLSKPLDPAAVMEVVRRWM